MVPVPNTFEFAWPDFIVCKTGTVSLYSLRTCPQTRKKLHGAHAFLGLTPRCFDLTWLHGKRHDGPHLYVESKFLSSLPKHAQRLRRVQVPHVSFRSAPIRV